MYGSIATGDASSPTEPLLAGPSTSSPPLPSATRVVDPRSRRQLMMRQQKAKRKLKEIQKEQPVLRSIFVNTADQQRKVKEQIKQKQERRASRSRSSIAAAAATTTTATTTAPLTQKTKKQKKKHHSFVYSMLSPYSNKWQARIFKRFIALVIITDLILFILSTDPNNPSPQSLYLTDKDFYVLEGLVSVIFLVEYLARLYCITEKTKYAATLAVPAWRARLTYMTTWPALLDLMATLPFFVELATQWLVPDFSLPRFTYLRCFRLFRILKTDSYIVAMDAVYRVVYYNREILTVAMLVCLALVLLTSVLLYICRPRSSAADNNNNVQNFDSIGDTLYIATLMLTGQGGPDGDNLPWYTKAVILLTSVFSVASK
jgi:Ion transport protein